MLRWLANRAGRELRATAVLAVIGGLLLLIWRGPWWLDGGHLTDKDLTGPAATLITGFRTTVVQVLVALGAVVALWFTRSNYLLSRRGQVTDRFTKALERLGSEELYVRYGGILALEQIVKDAPDQAEHAAQVLGAFIRDRAPKRQPTRPPASPRWDERPAPATRPRSNRPAEDVQAALTALTRPTSRRHVGLTQAIDLAGLHLARVKFAGADLSRIKFAGADLSDAEFRGADLTNAWLSSTDLTGASLEDVNLTTGLLPDADLTGAWLTGAKLVYARLDGAKLTRAQLGGADLTGTVLVGTDLTGTALGDVDLRLAQGLTADQVVAARPDHTTQLPAAIEADPAVIARIAEVEAKYEARRQQRAGRLAQPE